CMVTYSSYLEKDINLTSSASAVVSMNMFVSLLAGLAVFSVVFAFDLEHAEGPPLSFMVLPAAVTQIPSGSLFLSLFILLFYSTFLHQHLVYSKLLLRHLQLVVVIHE